MSKFINHVELVQIIDETLALLHDLGHFDYQDFSLKVSATKVWVVQFRKAKFIKGE